MSHPQAPTRQPTPEETKSYATTLHRAALFTLIVCPALAAIPPRKFDTYTIGLIGLTGFSANYLYKESRGHSIWHVIGGDKADTLRKETVGEDGDGTLPTARAREFQKQLRELREREARAGGRVLPPSGEEKKATILDKVYYGSEKPEGWRERRAREDQEKLAEGKGYGDIIMEQIWEVWNWGKTDDENDDEKK